MCVSALAASAAARHSARPCTAASGRGRKPRSYWDGPIRSSGRPLSSNSRACWTAPNTIGICWSTSTRPTSTRTRISAMAGPNAGSASGLPPARRVSPRASPSMGSTCTMKIPWARLVASCSLAEWGAEPPTQERPCKPSALDLTNTLLSAQISRRSSCPSNSAVQPGSSPPSLRAAARRCQSMRYPAATSLLSWRACLSSRRKHASGRGTSFPSSSFRKRGWTGSGSTASCRRKGSRAMSSIPPPSPHPGGVGGRRPTKKQGRTRRGRRAKTDKIDGEALVRALLAYKRGEPRVCAMVKAPTPHEEDRRRISRERETLTAERVQHVNRIKGLLFAQGIGDDEPLHRNRRERLEDLITGDGRPLPECLKAQIRRELDRLRARDRQG